MENNESKNQDFEVNEEEEVTIESDLNSWLSTLPEFDDSFSSTLYKYKNPNTNKYTLVFQWNSEIPEGHDIGLRFGSGRYNLVVRVRTGDGKQKTRSYKFEIDKYYDELRRTQRIDINAPLGTDPFFAGNDYNQQPQQPQQTNIDQGLMFFEKVISVLAPLIQNNQRQQKQQYDPSQLMFKTYENVNQIMKKNMIEQASMMSDIVRLNSGYDEEQEEDEGTGNQFIDMMKPYLETFLPMLKNDNVASRMAVGQLKKLPQYKQLLGNKKALNQVINYLVQKEGSEETEKILTMLKIKPNANKKEEVVIDT